MASLAALVALPVLVVTGTSWGHARIRGFVERSVAATLADSVAFRIGTLTGGLARPWVAESIALIEPGGLRVVSVARVSVTISVRSLLAGAVRLGVVEVDGVRAALHRGTDGVWNVQRLQRQAREPAGGPRARALLVTADSVVIRGSSVVATRATATTGSLRIDSLAVLHDVAAAIGPTVLSSPDGVGHATAVLTAQADAPRLGAVGVRAAAHWSRDSARVDSAVVTLPASRVMGWGAVHGIATNALRVDAELTADSVAFADLRAAVPRLPRDGAAWASAHVLTDSARRLIVDVRSIRAQSGTATVTGRATIVDERPLVVRGVSLEVADLDLALVRELAGADLVPAAWRGRVSATITAPGGSRDRFVFDRANGEFRDARTGTTSRLHAAGAVGVGDAGTRLDAVTVRAEPLVVRTLGAAAPAADSIAGTLVGSAVLDGTLTALRIDNLRVAHIGDGGARSVVRGAAFVSGAGTTRTLSADLTLDTIATATVVSLVPGAEQWKLREGMSGAVMVEATERSVVYDGTLAAADTRVRVAGDAQFRGDTGAVSATARIESLDPRAVSFDATLPRFRVSGAARLAASWAGADTTAIIDMAVDSTSTIGAAPIVGAGARLAIDGRRLRVDTVQVDGFGWTLAAAGRLPMDSLATDSLTFRLAVDSADAFRQLAVDTAGTPLIASASGRIVIDRGVVHGSLASPALRATVGLEGVDVGGAAAGLGLVTVDLTGLRGRTTGTARATLSTVSAAGVAFDSVGVTATLREGSHALVRYRGVAGDTSEIRGVSDVFWGGDSIVVRTDSAVAALAIGRWMLARPAIVARGPARWDVRDVELRTAGGASLSVRGSVPDTGAVQITAALAGLRLVEVPAAAGVPRDLAGAVTGNVRIDGTRDAPRITFTAALDSARNAEVARPAIRLAGEYAERVARVDLEAAVGGRRALTASARVPLDLALEAAGDRLLDAPMTMRMVSDSLPLSSFEGLVPRTRNLAGHLTGTVDLGGTLRQPRGTGQLVLSGGSIDVPRSGIALRQARADLALDGDSVVVRTIRVADADAPTDTAAVGGTIRFAGSSWRDWTVSLRSIASDFRVLDDPRLATAEADWDLTATGTLGRPRIGGSVRLPYAVFTIGPQRRTRVPPTDSAEAAGAGVPVAEELFVSLGSDVRLKSREANVQLTGAVELIGALDRPWISGMLQATRGTYRVDLGVLKRTFRVDSGTVIVEGTSDDPAVLDIRTSYTVRRAGEDDVKIGAHVYGTTDRPRLDLSSDLGSATAQSEVISYLVFGKPSFQAPQSRQATERTATAAIVPSLGGWLEGLLGTVLPFFNTLQVTTVASDDPRISFQNPLEGLLSSVAVTGGRQVGTDTFFSISAGTCSGSRVASTGNVPLWLGAAAEYRPRRSLGAAISVDPGPAPCSRVGAFADTYQVGFDLLYEWRFGRRR